MAFTFNQLNEDHQYAVLQQALPKLDAAMKLLDEVQDLYFSQGFSSPYPNMDDPVAAQALEDAQTAIGHLQNKLGHKNKLVEEVLIKSWKLAQA